MAQSFVFESAYLSPQNMEIICRCSYIHHLPITFLNLFPQGWIHLRDDKGMIITHLQYNIKGQFNISWKTSN